MLPYNIIRIVVWLQRLKYVKGFGIQSPSAFSFVNDIINDHYDYKEYSALLKSSCHCKALALKKAHLIFRLNKFHQAEKMYFYPEEVSIYKDYIKCGCGKTHVTEFKTSLKDLKSPNNQRAIFHFSIEKDYKKAYEELRKVINTDSFLIIDNIHSSTEKKAFWQQIVNDEHVSFSFDLYYLGIAFFDKRPKQNYIINF